MAFRNSILAGEELVRSGMRSPDWVAQTAGWRVGRDGTAEFNNVFVRGELSTGADPGVHIETHVINNDPIEPGAGAVTDYFTGDSDELYPGRILARALLGVAGRLIFRSPVFGPVIGSDDYAQLTLSSGDLWNGGAQPPGILLNTGAGGTLDVAATKAYIGPTGSLGQDLLGAWTPYTPAIVNIGAGTNWALGAGSAVGAYYQLGKFVIVRFVVTFGAGATFGTKFLGITVPVTAKAGELTVIPRPIELYDATGARVFGVAEFNTSTQVVLGALNTAGTYATISLVTSTIPFAWAVNDAAVGEIIYEAA